MWLKVCFAMMDVGRRLVLLLAQKATNSLSNCRTFQCNSRVLQSIKSIKNLYTTPRLSSLQSEWSLGCWLHLPPFLAYLHLDFTSLYWGNFVWISSNLGVQYWKSVIVIDVFLGYLKHYCISVSIPLNDTGRYRKGRACQLRTLKNRNSVTTKVKSHGLYELKSGMFAKSTKWLGPPYLDFTHLSEKLLTCTSKTGVRRALILGGKVAYF